MQESYSKWPRIKLNAVGFQDAEPIPHLGAGILPQVQACQNSGPGDSRGSSDLALVGPRSWSHS